MTYYTIMCYNLLYYSIIVTALYQSTTFQSEGLRSQDHHLPQAPDALRSFKAPRVWAHFVRLSF